MRTLASQSQSMPDSAALNRLAVILVIAILLSACGKPEARSTVITFGCLSDQTATYQALADEFHQIHPQITVHIQQVDSAFDPSNPVPTLQALATQADAFIWYNLGLDQAARLGVLFDLQPLLEKSSATEADFLSGVLDAFRFNNGLWGLAAYADPIVMFYDRAVFDQLGVAYPQEGWSWQDFLTVAKHLTQREGGETARYGFVDTSDLFPLALVYQHGGSLLQQEAGAPLMTPVLLDAHAVKALDWYKALATQYGVMPARTGPEAEDVSALVMDGRAAMWAANLSSLARWQAARGASSIGVAPLPEDVSAAHPLIAWGYVVSKGTANAQAAWYWIEYLTRRPGPPSASQGLAPARQSLAEAETYWTQLGEAAPAVRYALDHPLTEPGLLELWQIIRPITPLVRGEMSAEEFLVAAQARADAWQAERMAVQPQPIGVVPPPQTVQAAQTIVFGVMSDMQKAHYEALAHAFMRSHPDVRVEVKDVTAGSAVVERDRVAETTDVFVWQSSEYVDPGNPSVLDLAPLIEMDGSFPTGDYAPGLSSGDGGPTWDLPIAMDVQVIYYDRTLFDEAGIPYPSPEWSWDDLLTYGTQLATGTGPDKRYGFLSNWLPMDIYLYLEAHNVHLVQQQNGKIVYNFDSDAVKRAVQWWVDLDRKYRVMPPLMSEPGARDYQLLRARRVAMWSDWASNRGTTWLYTPDSQLGILPIPRGESTVANISVWHVLISARTREREACWQWVRYLSTHLPPGHLAPVRTSQLNSAEFRQQVSDDVANAYLSALEADSRLALDKWPGPFLMWLQEALDEIAGGADVGAALGKAQQKADRFAGQ